MLRHEDVHGNSGCGVVAEGCIFDSGMCVMTWISEVSTVTTFKSILDVKKLHSHDGKTEIVIEGLKKDEVKFKMCRERAKLKAQRIKEKEGES
jgi:hypothetical protein